MAARSSRALALLWLFASFFPVLRAPAQHREPPLSREHIEALIVQLGDSDFQLREDAARALFRCGPEVAHWLRERLEVQSDPEIIYRLRYILDNLEPPRQAVLVVHAAPESGLRAGMIITHANGRPVRDRAALREQMVLTPRNTRLRVHTADGPEETGPIAIYQLNEASDYVHPRGHEVAQALRWYSEGYSERAYELLRDRAGSLPEAELTHPLLAILAYTAGFGEEALGLMSGREEEVRAAGSDWGSPSYLDLRGPGKAPFHLEWAVATAAGPAFYSSRNDPDLRLQRILIPASRRADVLCLSAGYWWGNYRESLGRDDLADHVAGNTLAVTAWMFSELQLRSECCRLIEPRSGILRRTSSGYRKWIRVDTDAWLDFLAGRPENALDSFYDDAADVLQRPPSPGDLSANTRNPAVAARVAFFLYQNPRDPRIPRTLGIVQHHTHPALRDYLYWMLFSLNENNHEIVRRDLQATLPFLLDDEAAPYARAVALLEYVQRKPDLEILRAARRRLSGGEREITPPGIRFDQGAAETSSADQNESDSLLIDALIELVAGRPLDALRLLEQRRSDLDLVALRHTARFLADPPSGAADHAPLLDLILAIPMGLEESRWLVLARDRRLMMYDTRDSALTVSEKPAPAWFPNPITWPWIGRDEAAGCVWTYDRRRIREVPQRPEQPILHLNVTPAEIPLFQRRLAPFFGRLAETWRGLNPADGECGEFLRSEILQNAEYVADPDLCEIAIIAPLPEAPRFIYVALRGEPPVLIDAETDRLWTADRIGRQLGLDAPPRYFVESLHEPAPDGSPVLMLLSDHGLIRFETGPESLTRVPLPGSNPHPRVIPESAPYTRRDPRFFYCALPPGDGGTVFRLALADGAVETVDMINEALPEHFYTLQSRSEIRSRINQCFADVGIPDMETFLRETADTVARWSQEQDKKP